MSTRKLLFAISIVSALVAAQAHAGESGGGGVGNGGGAWTCRANTPGKELIWIELVDLFEARAERKLNVPSNDLVAGNAKSVDEWLEYAGTRLKAADPRFHADYVRFLAEVRKRFTLPEGVDFVPTRDIYFGVTPSDDLCPNGTISSRLGPGGVLAKEPEQLANFSRNRQLLVNGPLWNSDKLSNLNRAALLAHEAIYWMLRSSEMGGDPDSTRARLVVGYLFSDKAVAEFAAELPNRLGAAPATTSAQQPQQGDKPRGDLAPLIGIYGELVANDNDFEITLYEAAQRTLFINAVNRGAKWDRFNSLTFVCTPDALGLHCMMTSSTNGTMVDRGLDKYSIDFTSPSSFVFRIVQDSGAVKTTRYDRLPDEFVARASSGSAQQNQQRHQQHQQQQQAQQPQHQQPQNR